MSEQDTEHQRLVDLMEFPENVRVNSAMYIGDRENSSHILREIIDNSIDEAMDKHGCCDTIHIFQGKPNEWKTRWFAVTDNGRGIPLMESPKKAGWTMARLAVSQLSAGSNFQDRKGERESIGMNGLGAALVNALSEEFYVIISLKKQGFNISKSTTEIKTLYNNSDDELKQNGFYCLHYKKGILQSETLINRSKVDELISEFKLPDELSTLVAFKPDTESIFTNTNSNPVKDLRYTQPFLEKVKNKQLKFFVNGKEFKSDWKPYKYECKIEVESAYAQWYDKQVEAYDHMTPEEQQRTRLPIRPRNRGAEMYVNFEVDLEAMNSPEWSGSVNGLTVSQRVHTQFARSAFSEAMKICYSFDFRGREFNGMRFDVQWACVAPEYNSQTKETLVRVDGIQASDVVPKLTKEFVKIIKANSKEFDAHAERVKKLLMTMENMSLIDYVKAKVPTSADTRRHQAALADTKLKDCQNKNRKLCELYISEGDSAAGPIITARNPMFHAVMPLRGKIKNVVSKDIKEVLDNKELSDIYIAIGAGTEQNPDIEGCRYGKIIIASDADPDGYNIRALAGGFFATHLSFLIEAGLVYVLECPLYEQDGKFFWTKDGIDEHRPYHRFKGLGSMNPDQVQETILNPKTRHLTKLTLDKNDNEAKFILTSRHGRRKLLEDIDVIDQNTIITGNTIDLNKASEIVE